MPAKAMRLLKSQLALLALACFPFTALANDVAEVIARAKRSVVAVGTFERTRSPQFSFRGTGFAVEDGTLIVTNLHVVPETIEGNRMEQLGILIPQPGVASGTFREAKVVAMDGGTDLALLKVGGSPLPTLRIGDSDQAREGQSILLTGFPIGSALGPFAATHRGIISAIAPIAIPQARSSSLDPKVVRRLSQGAFNVLQLDATAYPGNSGSPVYDAGSGDVVGVVNMVFVKGTKESVLAQPSGITYAVPGKYVLELLQKAR
jgi:serine protease Do